MIVIADFFGEDALHAAVGDVAMEHLPLIRAVVHGDDIAR